MTEQTIQQEPPAAERPPPSPRTRRTVGLPVLVAVATGTLLIGGLAGGIIGYAVHPDRPEFGPGQQLRPGGPGGPNGQPPQPPGRDQQQDGSADEVPDGE